MNKEDYLKLEAMNFALRERIMQLKDAWYTSPAQYGRGLCNMPRHAHAGGKRVWHVTNF